MSSGGDDDDDDAISHLTVLAVPSCHVLMFKRGSWENRNSQGKVGWTDFDGVFCVVVMSCCWR